MGQSEGRAEKRGHRALPAFPHFFHGSHSVGWTLQQADNTEERGNEDLHGKKVDWIRGSGKRASRSSRRGESVRGQGRCARRREISQNQTASFRDGKREE